MIMDNEKSKDTNKKQKKSSSQKVKSNNTKKKNSSYNKDLKKEEKSLESIDKNIAELEETFDETKNNKIISETIEKTIDESTNDESKLLDDKIIHDVSESFEDDINYDENESFEKEEKYDDSKSIDTEELEIKTENDTQASDNNNANNFKKKLITFAGFIVLFIVSVFLMKYFFVSKSYIKINYSTDKKLEYIDLTNGQKMLSSQKYISDLEYTMRYDIDNFRVFKYSNKDYYKFKSSDKILVIVERHSLPTACTSSNLDMIYNNCYYKEDKFNESYYITTNGRTYKITIKNVNTLDDSRDIKTIIKYMLDSFEMTFD